MPQRRPGGEAGQEIDRNIRQRIRAYRELRGLSQSDLAERISVSYQQVQKYENGRTPITVTRLAEIARSLGVDVQTLVTESEETILEPDGGYSDRPAYIVHLTNDERDLVRHYRKIQNEKLKRSVLLQAKAFAEIEAANREP